MRWPLILLLATAPPTLPRTASAQRGADTMPERVVERMLEAFNRPDAKAWASSWDSVSYTEDLAVPSAGSRPVTIEQRTQAMLTYPANDPRGPAHRDLIQRLVLGRFVVCHIAVWWDSPYGDAHNFQKLEIYEVRNGKIVAEWDGQYAATGRPKVTRGP